MTWNTHPLLKLEPEDGNPIDLNMIEQTNKMKNNYKKINDITQEITDSEIEKEFDDDNLFKKVESIEQRLEKFDEVEKSMDTILEILKKNTINNEFAEEEMKINIKYVEKDKENMMLIDSGAPVSIGSSAWFKEYLKENKT